MSKFLAPNIDRAGRLLRGVIAVILLVAGALMLSRSTIVAFLLLAAGAFVLFEALRGWCAVRACGVRTRL
ncbi:MAG: DUF2892 domain-containing protein [Verrucomicrobiota bacterium]|nr:DUF2892 domain-containing protein [Verrucomicrobiota bacterium]